MAILHTEEKYSDNNGPYSVAHIWNGEKVLTQSYANGYDDLVHDSKQVDASPEDIEAAKEWFKGEEQSYKVLGQVYTTIRSRSFKKGTEVKVLEVNEGGYRTSETVTVTDGDKTANISPNCLDNFISGICPDWLTV